MSPRGLIRARGEDRPSVVALGGGHGLAVTLTSLRRLTDQITAVVGVADDGGSSGRLRAQFGILPPGDLRMALAALCGDDTWGRTWSQVIQHRFGGDGDLAGHSLGNLLITALWEQTHDAVEGLDWVAALLEAQGRVLPCATVPLEIVAQVRGLVEEDPEALVLLRGQVSIASTEGEVVDISLEPAQPPACPEAVMALQQADGIVLGPGSWFTSVLPHLLIPELSEAIMTSPARRVVVMNVDPSRDQETAGLPLAEHLHVMHRLLPGLRVDAVIVDPMDLHEMDLHEMDLHEMDLDHMDRDPIGTDGRGSLRAACDRLGARLEVASVRSTRPGTHDPDRLAVALRAALR